MTTLQALAPVLGGAPRIFDSRLATILPPFPSSLSSYYRVMEFFNDAGEDPLKPTLFELVAQEQLRDLLQPALKYVLSVRPDAPHPHTACPG